MWQTYSYSYDGGYKTGDTLVGCNASISIPEPSRVVSYHVDVTGSCNYIEGTACRLWVNGSKTPFMSGDQSGFARTASTGWSSSSAEVALGSINLTYQAEDLSGNAVCDPSLLRADVVWFF